MVTIQQEGKKDLCLLSAEYVLEGNNNTIRCEGGKGKLILRGGSHNEVDAKGWVVTVQGNNNVVRHAKQVSLVGNHNSAYDCDTIGVVDGKNNYIDVHHHAFGTMTMTFGSDGMTMKKPK